MRYMSKRNEGGGLLPRGSPPSRRQPGGRKERLIGSAAKEAAEFQFIFDRASRSSTTPSKSSPAPSTSSGTGMWGTRVGQVGGHVANRVEEAGVAEPTRGAAVRRIVALSDESEVPIAQGEELDRRYGGESPADPSRSSSV